MHEKTVQELISRYLPEVWPGRELALVGREVVLNCGRVDLLLRDACGSMWSVELKPDAFPPGQMPIAARYRDELRVSRQVPVEGVVAAQRFSPQALALAASLGLHVWTFDVVVLEGLAARDGLVLADAAPRPYRAQNTPSIPRGPGSKRGAPSPATVEALRQLDAGFAPSSIGADADDKLILRYWQAACPGMPELNVTVASRLSRRIFEALPQAAVGNRAAGGWTTFIAASGHVVAALDVKRRGVNFSLRFPEARARELAAQGLVRPHTARRGGRWCHLLQGPGLSEAQAGDLIQEAIHTEFGTWPQPAVGRT